MRHRKLEVTWDALLMMKVIHITGSHIVLFVCFCFKAISCFSDLRGEVRSCRGRVFTLINPSGSVAAFQTKTVSWHCEQRKRVLQVKKGHVET